MQNKDKDKNNDGGDDDMVLDCSDRLDDDGNYGRYRNNDVSLVLRKWSSDTFYDRSDRNKSNDCDKHYTKRLKNSVNNQELFIEFFKSFDGRERIIFCESNNCVYCCSEYLWSSARHGYNCESNVKHTYTCNSNIVTKTIIVTNHGKLLSLLRLYGFNWHCHKMIKTDCCLLNDELKELKSLNCNDFETIAQWLKAKEQAQTARKLVVSLIASFYLLPELVDIICMYV